MSLGEYFSIKKISAKLNVFNIPIVLFSGSNPTQEELDDMIDVRQYSQYSTIFVDYMLACLFVLIQF